LTKSRNALVASFPGLTRDRQYGKGALGESEYIVVDTGGLSGDESGINKAMLDQSMAAVEESHLVFFMVDARDGRTGGDEQIAQVLRQGSKQIILVANKIDGENPDFVTSEFSAFGFGEPHMIAAIHGDGIGDLITRALDHPATHIDDEATSIVPEGTKIAVIGRPNVGKSTLVNRLLGEERVVVYSEAGTTRDSIYVPFERNGERFTLIDTAGIRRRGKVRQVVEKFSVIKTLEAISDANVVILMLDARQGIVDQDLHLLSYALDAGRALIIAVNKWDGLDREQKESIKRELDRRLTFIEFARSHFISALHGSGVGKLYPSIKTAYASATKKIKTSQLNRILNQAVSDHPPPLVHGRRIKLRYANSGGSNPPVIVIHGNQTTSVPEPYKRYLQHRFIEALHLEGTPVRLEFRAGTNPYAGRKNLLSQRQEQKRRRLLSHVKSAAKKRKRR
jgi:GTP-binding protein